MSKRIAFASSRPQLLPKCPGLLRFFLGNLLSRRPVYLGKLQRPCFSACGVLFPIEPRLGVGVFPRVFAAKKSHFIQGKIFRLKRQIIGGNRPNKSTSMAFRETLRLATVLDRRPTHSLQPPGVSRG